MTPPGSRRPARYRTLDAWRGVAALGVVIFHCTNTTLTPSMGRWARVVLSGWAGVFVFFPISGYCILAALLRAENASVTEFMRRRWRRIVPPYWGSLALVIVVAYAASPFNGHKTAYLSIGAANWISVVTLTQVWVGLPAVVNPVYWTLCYEEQFYIVMALALLVSARWRLHLLFGVTFAATVYCSPLWADRFRVTGLFLSYWLSFAAGLAAYVWLHLPRSRSWAVTVFTCIAATLVYSHDPALSISTAAALAFIVLAPYDDAIAQTRAGAALIGLGLFSYSMYLVHAPVAGRVVNGLRRLPLPFLVPSAVAVLVSVSAGWLFYQAIERRFVNASPTPVETLRPLARVS